MGETRIIPYTQPWQFDSAVKFKGTVSATGTTITFSGSTISGGTFAGGSTSGATTLVTSDLVTATGATGGTGAAVSAVTPGFHTVTGTSGMGVDLPTGPAGTVHAFRNNTTGVLNIYCVGGTINGTTGTTAFAITATGNRSAFLWCTSATGAWTAGFAT